MPWRLSQRRLFQALLVSTLCTLPLSSAGWNRSLLADEPAKATEGGSDKKNEPEKKDADKKDADKKDAEKKDADKKDADKKDADKPEESAAGHSMHGEAFNEGPRQAAYLMEGMSNIQFEISSSHPLARKFFVQGVSQLHGFWYYEAERSFRQAATYDPQCAMCYWGMALANVNNRKRAEAFIAQAVERKSNATDREQMYIEAARKRFRETIDGKKPSKKETAETYTRDLEEIVLKYPDDIEAKAFFALQLWENDRNDLPLVSQTAVDAVLQDVFDKNPMHPAHHYRIHLWDKKHQKKALASAALCGPSLPGIAHMWHMPGHTYSGLHRYQDAVWQQEASARVDHAHMMRDRIMPDQIHNFAHNNEWMIRNLVKIGRVKDAVDLATNMISLPRHPKYNTLKGGSAKYGRDRLLLTLNSYRLWPQMIEAIESNLIQRGEDDATQIETLRHLTIAHAMLDHADQVASGLADLKGRLDKVEKELAEIAAADAPTPRAAKPDETPPPAPERSSSVEPTKVTAKVCEPDQGKTKPASEEDKKKAEANRKRRDERKKELESRKKPLSEAIAAVEAAQAARASQWDRALELFDKAGSWDKLLKAEWQAKAQKTKASVDLLKAEAKSNPSTVLPTAVLCYVRWQTSGAESARADFEALRELASTCDIETPLMARLAPLAAELGYDERWIKPWHPANDTGPRPSLDSLGPFRYSPYKAPAWTAVSRDGQKIESTKYAGRPTIVIFYLGFGCLHCMEQLQEFSPEVEKFREAGIDIVAISSESQESLAKGMENYDKPLNIPLVADPELKAFKAFRAFDDFEGKPLHGTFLIDAKSNVLWQDISYEPFKDDEFLLREAKRLLR